MLQTTLTVVLALIAAVDGMNEDTVFTPEDVIRNADTFLESAPITVRFRVDTVDTIRHNREDKSTFDQIRLHPSVKLDPSVHARFEVTLSESIQKTLQRIGMDDFKRHFKGKDIEVVGGLTRTSLFLKGSPTIWIYGIEISELKQVSSVTFPRRD